MILGKLSFSFLAFLLVDLDILLKRYVTIESNVAQHPVHTIVSDGNKTTVYVYE